MSSAPLLVCRASAQALYVPARWSQGCCVQEGEDPFLQQAPLSVASTSQELLSCCSLNGDAFDVSQLGVMLALWFKMVCLVSYGCCNKLPTTRCLKMVETYFLIVLVPEIWNWGFSRTILSLETLGVNLFHAFSSFWVPANNLWYSLDVATSLNLRHHLYTVFSYFCFKTPSTFLW